MASLLGLGRVECRDGKMYYFFIYAQPWAKFLTDRFMASIYNLHRVYVDFSHVIFDNLWWDEYWYFYIGVKMMSREYYYHAMRMLRDDDYYLRDAFATQFVPAQCQKEKRLSLCLPSIFLITHHFKFAYFMRAKQLASCYSINNLYSLRP